jgi:hypothetical protein
MSKSLVQWVLAASVLVGGLALAQSEPSMGQIYSTAQAGKLDEAQVMVQQVLIAHPKSAKAHFVQAELYARQGRLDKAREALATAEKFGPGLPFVKPEALTALRAQLSAPPVAVQHAAPKSALPTAAAMPAAPAQSGGSWVIHLLLTGGVIVAGYLIFRRRTPQPYGQPAAYGPANPLSGQQTFGTGVGPGAMQPAYGQAGYGQPGYGQQFPQQAGPGLGSRIAGGVATGLAVGAGVMAAEAIGRNLMGNHGSTPAPADNSGASSWDSGAANAGTNADMGGTDFGVTDTSWDDAGSADAGGGSDWDT